MTEAPELGRRETRCCLLVPTGVVKRLMFIDGIVGSVEGRERVVGLGFVRGRPGLLRYSARVGSGSAT
jgi:hypothetical protein